MIEELNQKLSEQTKLILDKFLRGEGIDDFLRLQSEQSFNTQKIVKIYDLIGKERFEKLDMSQIKFLASTVGIIKLDKNLDINQLYTYAKYAEY